MNNKLTNRLKEVGLSREKLIKVVNEKDRTVIVYTTHMDGLGVRASDFDVYVIGDDLEGISDVMKRGNHYAKLIDFDPKYYQVEDIPYLFLDIEYWTYKNLDEIMEKVLKKKAITVDEIKLLYRLRSGECINNSLREEFREKLEEIPLNSYVAKRYASYSDQALHDCVSLYQNEDYYGAILCGRQAINYAITGLNAKHGKVNLNVEKWCSRIFFQENGYGKYLDVYKHFMFENLIEDNVKNALYEMILFIQDILNYELDFLGKKHWLKKEKYNMLDESGDLLYRV